MKTSTTFSILFWLKQSKAKNGEAPLYARITVNGQRAEISLKRKIKIANWNATKNRAKGTNQEARTINEYLNQVQKGIIQSKNELTLENKFITSQAIKSRYLKEDEQNHTLNDIIKYHNEDMVNKLRSISSAMILMMNFPGIQPSVVRVSCIQKASLKKYLPKYCKCV